MTIKDILTENRDSVISSIKFAYKVYRIEDIKPIMGRFLDYCEKNAIAESLATSKKVKTDLKNILAHMKIAERRAFEESENLRIYGKKNPKLEDIMAKREEMEEAKGNVWNPILKDWTKSKYQR